MSTLDATVSLLKDLPENDLLTIYDLTRRFYMKNNKGVKLKVMTEVQMRDRLDSSRKQASEGMVIDADVAVSKLRAKYGL